nr:alpha/beta hydrolase fold domain-containing protein [Maribacter polysiphoniae]
MNTRNKTTPFEAIKDAKSAIWYIRANAQKFQVDFDKIIVSGGPAEGYLAAATALIENYNEGTDDLYVDYKPNALVLFNSVIDISIDGYAYHRIGIWV